MTCPVCSGGKFFRRLVDVSAGVGADVVLSDTGRRTFSNRVRDGHRLIAEVCSHCSFVLLFSDGEQPPPA